MLQKAPFATKFPVKLELPKEEVFLGLKVFNRHIIHRKKDP